MIHALEILPHCARHPTWLLMNYNSMTTKRIQEQRQKINQDEQQIDQTGLTLDDVIAIADNQERNSMIRQQFTTTKFHSTDTSTKGYYTIYTTGIQNSKRWYSNSKDDKGACYHFSSI